MVPLPLPIAAQALGQAGLIAVVGHTHKAGPRLAARMLPVFPAEPGEHLSGAHAERGKFVCGPGKVEIGVSVPVPARLDGTPVVVFEVVADFGNCAGAAAVPDRVDGQEYRAR